MDKLEQAIKLDEDTVIDVAEKLKLVSNTNMVTKEELLHKIIAKDVIKNKMINVAGQVFIEYDKELDNSNQTIKGYEDFFRDDKIRKDILEKVCGDNIKEICSAKDEVYRNNSMNRFIKILNNKKREMLSTNNYCGKKYQKHFFNFFMSQI